MPSNDNDRLKMEALIELRRRGMSKKEILEKAGNTTSQEFDRIMGQAKGYKEEDGFFTPLQAFAEGVGRGVVETQGNTLEAVRLNDPKENAREEQNWDERLASKFAGDTGFVNAGYGIGRGATIVGELLATGVGQAGGKVAAMTGRSLFGFGKRAAQTKAAKGAAALGIAAVKSQAGKAAIGGGAALIGAGVTNKLTGLF